VIPPAWSDVWICARADGHIQATGRDVRGRKQYRYHRRWRAFRDDTKYARLLAFAEALPRLRARVEADIAKPGLRREKVLATVVRLLEMTMIRIGNDEYARTNGSFGLTTLRDKHVAISGSALRFRFRGKSGKERAVEIHDRRLAAIVRRCRDLPGYELFQYVDDDGTRRTIDSADVNAYVREASGRDFTAKDFRTWAGTVEAACALDRLGPATSPSAARRNVVQAIKEVSRKLGNTAAVCKRSYVHPGVLEAYLAGMTLRNTPPPPPATAARLRDAEAAVVALLGAELAREKPSHAA
jgi:DNA topoisomerase-1